MNTYMDKSSSQIPFQPDLIPEFCKQYCWYGLYYYAFIFSQIIAVYAVETNVENNLVYLSLKVLTNSVARK